MGLPSKTGGEKMRRFIIRDEKCIMVRIQEREPKITASGRQGYKYGHSKSISIYGSTTVEEIHKIITEALKEASKKKVVNI